MASALELELRRLQLGDHACLFFDSTADDWRTIVPYFQEGLRRRERCSFLSSADELSRLEATLSAAGVDVPHEVGRGAVCELDVERALGGRYDPKALVALIEQGAEQALADGFQGLRACGHVGAEGLEERVVLESCALLNEVLPRLKAVVICRYDMRSMPPSLVRRTLQAHAIALVGSLVCPNPFFEPPSVALSSEEERVRWMIEQLSRSREAQRTLEEAVRARDEFMAAASHELRTPLTSSRLNVQRLLRLAEGSADDHVSARAAVQMLRRAEEQMERLGRVVEDLLDASRMREPDLALDVEVVDLVELVRDAMSGFDACARRAGCTLCLEVTPEPIVGRWDRGRLGQVVTNLLSNAVKFGAGKPVELRVSRETATARLIVRDHGSGIATEDLGRVFERFERAVPITQYGGFGLGLWIVRRIVEACGGVVVAGNAADGGAIFTVDLPIAA